MNPISKNTTWCQKCFSIMASVKLQPQSPFNFQSPDEWPRWKRRFEQFRHDSGLSSKGDSRQVSTLLYCMGETEEDVLSSTDVMAKEKQTYVPVIAEFDSFFKVRKNVIFERARCQEDGESAEQFITHSLSRERPTIEAAGEVKL